MSIKNRNASKQQPNFDGSGAFRFIPDGNNLPRRAVVSDRIVVESLKISGDVLMSQIEGLIEQGNVHRIVIKNKEGHTLLSVPTNLNAVGNTVNAILAAEETAINVISAILPNAKVVVEKIA